MRVIMPVRGALMAMVVSVTAACQDIPTEALRLLTIDIEGPATSVAIGESLMLGVSAATPTGARLELVGLNWRSTDPRIATVEDGRVRGLLAGRTYVHAFVGGIADSLLVTVTPASEGAGGLTTSAPSGCWESRSSPLGPTTIC